MVAALPSRHFASWNMAPRAEQARDRGRRFGDGIQIAHEGLRSKTHPHLGTRGLDVDSRIFRAA